MARGKTLPSKASTQSDAPKSHLLLTLRTIISLVSLSSSVFVTRHVLSPLFGSGVTNVYLQNTVSTLTVLLAILPLTVLSNWRETLLGTYLCIAPCVVHWLATLTARFGDPVLGPMLAYTPVLLPIIYLVTDTLRNYFRANKLLTLRAATGISLSTFVILSQRIWSCIPFNRFFSQPMLSVVVGWSTIVVGYLANNSSTARGKRLRRFKYGTFILPSFFTLLALSQPPTIIRSLPFTHPNGLLRILSSTPSVTGRIIVGEDYTHGFRFLRADHSLLGGVWIDQKYLVKMDEGADFVRDKSGKHLGDSIYSAFVLQEAARLQERDQGHQNVLIIGLGVGIAAQSFMQHGLNTSIVEVDPAVYSAARDFFGVPEPNAVHIEDARQWVHRQSRSNNGTYDIIVHDVFSGGGVPAHLFTSEFWKDAKKILSSDGIIAVNYAGSIGSESSKALLITLKKSFGQCRIFHDYKMQVPEEKLVSEFINLVYFCSPSTKPLSFRPAIRADFLSSHLRENILRLLPEREVRPELILANVSREEESKYILTDEHNPLGAWQDKGALHHWKVMRSLLPDYVWNTY